MSDAVAVTEMIIALHRGEIRLRPITTVNGRMFQARMWREYARAWDGCVTPTGMDREWVRQVLRVSRDECLRRARVNVYLARRLNRRLGGKSQ
jgi:hypothetical protein